MNIAKIHEGDIVRRKTDILKTEGTITSILDNNEVNVLWPGYSMPMPISVDDLIVIHFAEGTE